MKDQNPPIAGEAETMHNSAVISMSMLKKSFKLHINPHESIKSKIQYHLINQKTSPNGNSLQNEQITSNNNDQVVENNDHLIITETNQAITNGNESKKENENEDIINTTENVNEHLNENESLAEIQVMNLSKNSDVLTAEESSNKSNDELISKSPLSNILLFFVIKDWKLLLTLWFLGNLGITVSTSLSSYAIKLTNATTAGLFTTFIPIVTEIFVSGILRWERMNRWKLTGIILATIGVLGIFDLKQFDYNHILGCILFLVSYLCYAIFLIFQKGVIAKVGSFRSVFWFTTFAFLSLCIMSIYFRHEFQIIHQLTFSQWMAMTYAGLIVASVPNVLNAFAIRHTSPALAGLFQNLQPILISVFAAIILQERMTTLQYFGGLFVFIGVCCGTFGQITEENKKIKEAQKSTTTIVSTETETATATATPITNEKVEIEK